MHECTQPAGGRPLAVVRREGSTGFGEEKFTGRRDFAQLEWRSQGLAARTVHVLYIGAWRLLHGCMGQINGLRPRGRVYNRA